MRQRTRFRWIEQRLAWPWGWKTIRQE